jgi:hypothetical protein
MKNNIGQASYHCPEDLLMSSAQDTSKPTRLEKNKVPKFSHRTILANLRKRPLPVGNGLEIWWRFRDSYWAYKPLIYYSQSYS